VESGWNGRTPLVALAPGAAYGGAKRWPPEYFAELADGLAGDGVQCVIVGTAADAPTAHDVARALKARDRGPAAFAPQALRRASPKLAPVSDERRRESAALLNLVGRTELPTLAGVFDNCRALVTNDSGAMHLAAAVGIAVTAMFGPTNEQATSPRTPNPDPRIPNPESRITILTHSVWCRPCMLRECPLDHRCMRGIEVATVLEAARSSL
jgi:heptosyltransferase-2